jgi:prepilin-type N-terminal cleavage/methylation domain-containing protein
MKRPTMRRRRATGARRGFTLIELMFAMMLLTVGLLSLETTSASVLRAMGGGRQQTMAAQLGQSRLERMRGINCGSITSGSATTNGIAEKWGSVVLTSANTAVVNRRIADTVTYSVGSVSKTRVFTSVRPCP